MHKTLRVSRIVGRGRDSSKHRNPKEILAATWASLPQGSGLPEDSWRHRHRGILVLLWLHVFGVAIVADVSGHSLLHGLVESSVVAVFAVLAGWQSHNRRRAAALASLGLLSASAILVHLSNGNIEAHFHFFVVISVVTLYQDWVPFLIALGMVLLHHGAMGVVDPRSVYDHGDAILYPWKWAAIHGAFVLAASAASIINWRLAERLRNQERQARADVEALLQAAAQLSAETDPDRVLMRTAAIAAESLKVRRAGVVTQNGVLARVRYLSGDGTWRSTSADIPLQGTARGWVLQSGQPYLNNNLDQGSVPDPQELDGFESKTLLCVPIAWRDGEVLAALALHDRQDGAPFTHEDQRLAEGIAHHAAAALERAAMIVRLQKSEERFRLLAENAQDLIFRTQLLPELRTDYVSPAAETILGYKPDEFTADPRLLESCVHQDDRHLLLATSSSADDDVIIRCMRRDGEQIWLGVRNSPIHDEAGTLIAIEGIARDITSQRRADDKIRSLNENLEQRVFERTAQLEHANRELADQGRLLDEARAYLDHLLTLSPVIMFRERRIGTDRLITYLSPNFGRILGYSSDEALGLTDFWSQRVHPADRGSFDSFLQRQTVEPLVHYDDRELRILHKDGTYRWVQYGIRYERNEQGKWSDVLGYLSDITERRQTLEALEQAKTEAEQANLAKSEFLSRISHELRTPLNAILGFAELLEMDQRSDEDHQALQLILAGGRHLLELINEVLDIARIEAGALSLSTEPVDIKQLLREALALIRPLASERGVQVEELSDQESHFVMADHQRLKQVFLNLLSNAVKYSHPGGVVRLRCEEQPRRRLRTVVSDNGIGIPSEAICRLFSPFDRLGAERTGVEGTGLGLALSKRLVEAMQGQIEAESVLGQGSSFWVELPISEQQDGAFEMPPDLGVAATADAADERCVVLYIEDNLPNFTLVERILYHRPNVRLLPAMQGSLGLELAREHLPDLILLDVHLPDISGDVVVKRLRDDPRTRDIPVVMISADATPHQVERLLECGASAYLTKPLQVTRFLEVLDLSLENGRSLRQTAAVS